MSYNIDKLDEFMAAVTVEMDADNARLRGMYRHLRAHMEAQERTLQKAIESNTENAQEAESLASELKGANNFNDYLNRQNITIAKETGRLRNELERAENLLKMVSGDGFFRDVITEYFSAKLKRMEEK